jgi:proton glutamate symport protein
MGLRGRTRLFPPFLENQDSRTEEKEAGVRVRYLTLGSLFGIVGGFALGLTAHVKQSSVLLAAARYGDLFGRLWTGVLCLIVIPMVVIFIFLSVLSFSGTRAAGRVGMNAILIHVGLLVGSAILTVMICLWFVPKIHVSLPRPGSAPESAVASTGPLHGAERAKAVAPLESVMGPIQEYVLPVILATFLLALASSRLPETRREALLVFSRKAAGKFGVLLNGILLLIPGAVFCLSFALAAEAGFSLALVIVSYIFFVSSLVIVYIVGLYVLGVVGGGLPLRSFVSALWPSLALAAGTRSSLACLPSLLEGAARLGLPPPVAGFVLPLSVSSFKLTRAVSTPLNFIFLAHVYGIRLAPATVAGFVLASLLLSFTTLGVPSGGKSVTLPLYLAAGIPLEGYVLLGGLDAIPDIFKTMLHVSEGMAVTAVVSRRVNG